MNTEPCPVCEGRGRYEFTAGDSVYGVSAYRARLFRCDTCRSLFQAPMPDGETLASFYPSGYWREHETVTPFLRLQKIYVEAMLRWDLMGWIGRLGLPPGGSVLDLGCSRGDWLALIRGRGFRVKGIEGDARAAAYARERWDLEVDQLAVGDWKPEPEQWDAITLFHLLEHVPDPRALLEQCRRALKPEGRLLLRIPNIASWQFGLLKQRWKGLEIPRHLVLSPPEALVALLKNQGFQVERLSTWSLRDGPPALASSLFPAGEPTHQQIHGRSRPLDTLVYLMLTWLLTPIEAFSALCGRGAMTTLIARKT